MTEYAESTTGSLEVGADVAVADLVEQYERLLLVITSARAGAPTMPTDLARHATRALALACAILDGLAVERWPIVCAGLTAGVAVADVGAALGGFDPDEVAAGLTSWADRQYRAGALSDTEHARVVALVVDAA